MDLNDDTTRPHKAPRTVVDATLCNPGDKQLDSRDCETDKAASMTSSPYDLLHGKHSKRPRIAATADHRTATRLECHTSYPRNPAVGSLGISDRPRSIVTTAAAFSNKPMSGRPGKEQEKGKRVPWLEKLRRKEKSLNNARDAEQLFSQLLKQKDTPERLMLELNDPLIPVLMDGLALLSNNLSQPLELLAVLGHEKLSHGVYAEFAGAAFKAYHEAPSFMRCVKAALEQGQLSDPAAVAWMLIKLASQVEEVRQCRDAWTRDVVQLLCQSNAVGMDPLKPQLRTLFAMVASSTPDDCEASSAEVNHPQVESLQAAKTAVRPPGVRDHDNDSRDFRSIKIVPTASELNCLEGPYLPPVEGSSFIGNREAALLDRQFRLLREDLVGSLQEQLKDELAAGTEKFRHVYSNLQLVGINTDSSPCFLFKMPIPMRLLQRVKSMKTTEALDFFHNGLGRKILAQDTLVVLMGESEQDGSAKYVLRGVKRASDGSKTDTATNINAVAVGVVSMRRGKGWDILTEDRLHLMVGVSFFDESSASALLQMNDMKRNLQPVQLEANETASTRGATSLLGLAGRHTKPTERQQLPRDPSSMAIESARQPASKSLLFSGSAGFFTYEPVLRLLQKMPAIPLSDTLVHYKTPGPPQLPHGGRSFSEFSTELQDAVKADPEQTAAMDVLLSSQVVLVQGPPGTGKTYVGVQMAKAVLEADKQWGSSSKPIKLLCLCYTNHALDSFLESIMDAGVPETDFVRLGNSPQISKRLHRRCLQQLPDPDFNGEERWAYARLKSERSDLIESYNNLSLRLPKTEIWGTRAKWWKQVQEFLAEEHYEELDQLTIPQDSSTLGYMSINLPRNYLWRRWCRGEDRGVLQVGWNHNGADVDLWAMSTDDRRALKSKWNSDWKQQIHQELIEVFEKLNKNYRLLQELRLSSKVSLLQKTKIIGCTTVGAAKMHQLLQKVAPDVVLVEEAGEILEGHVLSALGQNCKQLILIGDHFQLRPKAECYALRKESGNGLDLDVSLFERLVTHQDANGDTLPRITLKVQHRMRPEVSRLIRETMYPDLVDHESTLSRPRVPGMAKPVVMISHTHPEMHDVEGEDLGSQSRVNAHEAQMACLLTQHLLHQKGISTGSVTILTPYLGQLFEIRKLLATLNVKSELSDADQDSLIQNNLEENGSNSDLGNHKGNTSVRVATVDNFQGEESDIVIISLVRSNRHGDIGFLSNAQRVNVLLSRARNGMYIFGNMSCLTNCQSSRGRALWRTIQGILTDHQQLLDFVPAVCEQHMSLHRIREPKDFKDMAPHGGCTVPCNATLACGHPCPLPCHGNSLAVHNRVKCPVEVVDQCAYGHTVKRKCSSSVQCFNVVQWMCPQGHMQSGRCYEGRSKECKICKKLEEKERQLSNHQAAQARKITEASEKLADLESAVKAALLAKESEATIKNIQKEQELVRNKLASLQNPRSDTPHESSATSVEAQPKSASAFTKTKTKIVSSAHQNKTQSAMASKAPSPTEKAEVRDQIAPAPASENVSAHDANKGPPSTDEAHLHPMSDQKIVSGVDAEKVSEHDANNGPPLTDLAHLHPQSHQEIISGVDADLCDVLALYSSKGALHADNVLDSILKANPDYESNPGFRALRVITLAELDPAGVASWDSTQLLDGQHTAASLSDAVSCWALFVQYESQFPMLAQQQAEKLLKFADRNDLGSKLPTLWLERAQQAVAADDALKPKLDKQHENASDTASAARIQETWQNVLKDNPKAPKVMQDLLGMIGLEEVKKSFISQYHRITIAQQQDGGAAASYNARFDGNPGTGKTTVARHYSTFLKQLGVLPKDSLVLETSGASLILKGTKHMEDKLEEAKKAGGGVVFIDEAYQLVSDRNGKQVLDFILPLAEGLNSKYGPLVWIFAGYSKDMDKLFEHNPGLPSRFPLRFRFTDYSDEQLLEIFKGHMTTQDSNKSSTVADKSAKTGNGNGQAFVPRQDFSYSGYPTGHQSNDRFGNCWTWNGSSWYDKYNNTTGYGPEYHFASSANPVISPNGVQWTHNYQAQEWCSNTGMVQKHYPGSSPPPTVKEARPHSFHCKNDSDLEIGIRRLGRGRRAPGFGNARAVRAYFDVVRGRQADRLAREQQESPSWKLDIFEFTQTDLLGPPPNGDRIRSTKAYAELQRMEGLKPVKDQVEQLIKLVDQNWKREQRGKPILDVVLNRIFLGNPGTGKTTVAGLYARLLGEMGLLSKGDVILKTPSDFVGDVLGSSEKATRDILKAAEGCVLVIDEAYSLYSGGSGGTNATNDPYKTAVIDTLVEQVQARPGDDRAVVLLGYEDEMRLMLKHVNPGLSRRFQLEHAFVFPDYSDSELIRILMAKARKDNLGLDISVAKAAVASLAGARAKPNFGNAGTLENMLSEAKLRMQKRQGSDTLTIADFALAPGLDNDALNTLFDDIVGCDNLKEKLESLRSTVEFHQARGEDLSGVVSYSYIFTGRPGTGKTTIARRMGRMFKLLGLLPDDNVLEVSASDLLTGYVGQAGKKMKEVMQRSRGGVLFIDEAYQLDPQRGGSYMTEVVDELVRCLTAEEFKDKILVILAGYKNDMERMLSTNEGLRSRFAERLHFEDLTQESIVQMAQWKMSKRGLPMSASAREQLPELARELAALPSFSNGRDVDQWCLRTYQAVASRAGRTKARTADIQDVDLCKALKEMKTTRTPVSFESGAPGSQRPITANLQYADATQSINVFAPPAQSNKIECLGDLEDSAPIDEPLVESDPPPSAFSGMDTKFLQGIQDILDQEGLNTEEGMSKFASCDSNDPIFRRVRDRLVAELGMTPDEAENKLKEWQSAQADLHEELRQLKEQKALGIMGQEPIWRCAVCGRADKPWIACWVAPYIVGYRAIQGNGK